MTLTNRKVLLEADGLTGADSESRAKLRFASAFDPRRNNSDLVRLVAAVTVLVSHAYSISASKRPELFDRVFGYGDGGSAAVAVFFVLSGFLIARSVERSTTTGFIKARILRIVPALFVVSMFEAFIIGPIFFDGPIQSYWPEAWEHLLNARVFGLRGDLPGVFASNPIPNYVNGSLWSLPVECLFYVAMPVLAALGGLRPLAVILFAILALILKLSFSHFTGTPYAQIYLAQNVGLSGIAPSLWYFLAGCAAWSLRERIPFSRGFVLLAFVALFAARGCALAPLVFAIALPYVSLMIGMSGNWGVALKRRIGDLSYGTYLFAFSIEQAVVAVVGRDQPELMNAIALPITLVLAYASWHALAVRGRRKLVAVALADRSGTS